MIEPTEADIGRRVVYDPRPALTYTSRGTLVGLTGGPLHNWTQVLFDDAGAPLNVGNEMLQWADAPSSAKQVSGRGPGTNTESPTQ